MRKQMQKGRHLQITKLTVTDPGGEGAPQDGGKVVVRTRPFINPGPWMGPGLGLKAIARPMGVEVRAWNNANFLPRGCRVWDLFCLHLSWLGMRGRLQIWRQEHPGSGNSGGLRKEWGGLVPWS